MNESISFTLNGTRASLTVDTDRKLLWVLRTDLGLTGTKYGCGENHCGACTVLIGGEAVRSCQVSMNEIRNREVTTIEGLAHNGKLHAVQQAFVNHDALQCGYCTPGMIMTAAAFLKKTPRASRDDMIRALDDNLCRCAVHKRIVEAIQEAATRQGG